MAAVMTRLRRPQLTVDYSDDLRLFRTRFTKVALFGAVVLYALLPLFGFMSNFWLGVLVNVGIFSIGAVGLNLLTGYTGQVSLGHAFFLAVGAYCWAHFGGEQDLPFLLWLPITAVVGGVVGALIGPFALRLRGNYLAIVSLGLVFIGQHVWNNWESVTGGSGGISGARAVSVGSLDFADMDPSGKENAGYFWLVWAVLALCLLLSKNIVRTRPGRALQAVRDRDVAASIIGVNLARYKVAAFALSSAMAAVAGGLLGSFRGYVHPDDWSLILSIQFVAIIIVGGVGTLFGSVLGALFVVGGPAFIEDRSDSLPVVSWLTEQANLSVADLNQLLFGLAIILFLVLEPHGLAGIWFRIKAYFKTWPFSY